MRYNRSVDVILALDALILPVFDWGCICMHISVDLEAAIRDEPEKHVDAILGISDYSDDLANTIASSGFKITGREQIESGMLYGRIRLADIRFLQNINEVQWIELDSTQYAL